MVGAWLLSMKRLEGCETSIEKEQKKRKKRFDLQKKNLKNGKKKFKKYPNVENTKLEFPLLVVSGTAPSKKMGNEPN